MFSIRPNEYYKSIYDINYSALKENGVKLILFDVYGTLIKNKKTVLDEKTVLLFSKLRLMGFNIRLFTNKPSLNNISEIGYSNVMKPFQDIFKVVAKDCKMCKCEMVIIGNNPFTDILGGNIFEIKTILVDTIGINVENILNKVLFRRRLNK